MKRIPRLVLDRTSVSGQTVGEFCFRDTRPQLMRGMHSGYAAPLQKRSFAHPASRGDYQGVFGGRDNTARAAVA